MEFFDVIEARRSVRAYTADQIPDETLKRILEASRLAPSAMNYQPWRFIIVRSQKIKDRIAQNGMFARFASQAPIIIVACGDTKSRFYIHDTCIALEHAVLAATSLGLGSCWIGSFNEEELREDLGIPERFKVVALLSVGHPEKNWDLSRAFLHLFRTTKDLGEIAFDEKFGKPFD